VSSTASWSCCSFMSRLWFSVFDLSRVVILHFIQRISSWEMMGS
jgi:hypothetical protein